MLIYHYNIATDSDAVSQRPLCGATAMWGHGYSRGYYTRDKEQVGCRRCLKSLSKPRPTRPKPMVPVHEAEDFPF